MDDYPTVPFGSRTSIALNRQNCTLDSYIIRASTEHHDAERSNDFSLSLVQGLCGQ